MRVLMAAALLLVAACDGAAPGTSPVSVQPYSCRASFPGADGGAGMLAVCLDVSGGTAQDLENNRQKCEMENNTFALAPCPHEGALGGCRETAIGIVLTTWYYADGSATASDIQMLCEGLAGTAPSIIKIDFVTP
jgi:hypothetical protein